MRASAISISELARMAGSYRYWSGSFGASPGGAAGGFPPALRLHSATSS